MSDSDSDTFVVVGTPLQPYEEDEPVKKQFDIQNQKVKDARGKQRFHGAFTGGFSAGYFNTVGSKEGWTPSTFVSKRGSRAGNIQQNPEDFMDEEDLGEYGIAPRLVKATDDFTRHKATKRPIASDGLIPGEAPLASIIKPARVTMGIRLLRKLGWRDGQGIGPRTKKKNKRKEKESKKVYGCSLPGMSSNQADTSDEDIPELLPADATFAPKDTSPIDFKPKDNLYGLGYSGLVMGRDHFNLFDVSSEVTEVTDHRGKRGIKGQAFGVGALEEDDEDIYAPDKLSNYDRVLSGVDNTGTYGWTAPVNKGSGTPKDYADTLLEGFTLMSAPLKPRKIYHPPQLPRDFKPYHVFTEEERATTKMAQEIPKRFSMSWKKVTVPDRREALGEKPNIRTVFDLVNEKDKQHMKSCQANSSPSTSESSKGSKDSEKNEQMQKSKAAIIAGLSNKFQSAGTEVISLTANQESVAQSEPCKPEDSTPLCQSNVAFKPFSGDPEKQARYEKYLSARASGNTDDYDDGAPKMTEWERSKEKDDFSRASQLYRPMTFLMASRFTRAKFKDDDKVVVNKEQGGDVTEQAKAANMKMFGKLTHDSLEWHPDKLLCKRFNVPNPYPDSSVVGLPKVKRDKFSIFNFLSIPGEGTSSTADNISLTQANEESVEPQELTRAHKKKLGHQGKPLAILASIDLNQPFQSPEVTPQLQSEAETSKHQEDGETMNDQINTTTSVLPSRPPPDIFKAVFGDSSTEESSSEDEDEAVGQLNVMPETITENIIQSHQIDSNINDKPNTLESHSLYQQTSKIEAYDVFGVKIELSEVGSKHQTQTEPKASDMEPGSTERCVDASRTEVEGTDTYGPPLPPGLGQNKTTVIEGSFAASVATHTDQHRKKKKHREKEKLKHKKKSKHKKHKHKKKKKHKVIVIGTPSGSEADSEDSSSEEDTLPKHRVAMFNH